MLRWGVFASIVFVAVMLVLWPTVALSAHHGGLNASEVALAGVIPFSGMLKRRKQSGQWNEMSERLPNPGGKFSRSNRMISGVAIPAAWADYNTQDPNGFELVHNPLWFTRTYTDNVTTTLNFFDLALATDDLFTNIFPYQNSYLLKALGVYILNNLETDDMGTSAANVASAFGDVQLLVNTAVLDFKIGKKDYGPFPLWRLASGGGVWGVVAAAGAEAANQITNCAQVGMPNPDCIYKLAIPVVIPAQTQCTWRMRWPAGAVDLAGGKVIKLILEGIEARPRQ